MSDFYSATIFLSAFIMIIMDMLVSGNDLMEHDKKQTVYTISVLAIAGMVSEWFGVWMDRVIHSADHHGALQRPDDAAQA